MEGKNSFCESLFDDDDDDDDGEDEIKVPWEKVFMGKIRITTFERKGLRDLQ